MLLDNVHKKSRRYEQIRREIVKAVSGMQEGSKLPSVRALMSKYEVSQGTIERALAELKDRGHLRMEVGKGTFVSRPGDRLAVLPSQVDMLYFGTPESIRKPGFHREFCDHLFRCLGEQGVGLRESVLPPECSRRQVVELLQELKPKAMVVVNLFDGELSHVLHEVEIPHVLLYPNWPSQLPNSFYVDNAGIVRAWLEHLIGLGHQRIAYLHCVSGHVYERAMEERLKLFYQEMAGRKLLPDLVKDCGFTPEEGYEATKALFDSGEEFTAIIVNDNAASGVYRAIHERGLEVGRDISVIGTDDVEWCSHMHPALTSVRIPRKRIAERVVDKLKHLILNADKTFGIETIEVELIARQSTQPARKQQI